MKMTTLCFLVALMAVAIASPVGESEALNKRILPGIFGEGGGGGDGGLLGSILDPVADVLGKLVSTAVSLFKDILSGLKGKSTQDEFWKEFEKTPIDKLCPNCNSLEKQDYISSCVSFCDSKNWKA